MRSLSPTVGRLARFLPLVVLLGLFAAFAPQTGQPATENLSGSSLLQGFANKEHEMLLQWEGYWNTRITYPTGRFEQRWLYEAALQDRSIPRAVPSGRKTYRRTEAMPLTILK